MGGHKFPTQQQMSKNPGSKFMTILAHVLSWYPFSTWVKKYHHFSGLDFATCDPAAKSLASGQAGAAQRRLLGDGSGAARLPRRLAGPVPTFWFLFVPEPSRTRWSPNNVLLSCPNGNLLAPIGHSKREAFGHGKEPNVLDETYFGTPVRSKPISPSGYPFVYRPMFGPFSRRFTFDSDFRPCVGYPQKIVNPQSTKAVGQLAMLQRLCGHFCTPLKP